MRKYKPNCFFGGGGGARYDSLAHGTHISALVYCGYLSNEERSSMYSTSNEGDNPPPCRIPLQTALHYEICRHTYIFLAVPKLFHSNN